VLACFAGWPVAVDQRAGLTVLKRTQEAAGWALRARRRAPRLQPCPRITRLMTTRLIKGPGGTPMRCAVPPCAPERGSGVVLVLHEAVQSHTEDLFRSSLLRDTSHLQRAGPHTVQTAAALCGALSGSTACVCCAGKRVSIAIGAADGCARSPCLCCVRSTTAPSTNSSACKPVCLFLMLQRPVVEEQSLGASLFEVFRVSA
jgi:hypothetical protein